MNNLIPQHHPDQNLLTEFVAGSLEHAPAIAISAHLHYCARCRNEVKRLEEIGGTLLFSAPVTGDTDPSTQEDAFNRLMSQVETQQTHTCSEPVIKNEYRDNDSQDDALAINQSKKIATKLEGLPTTVRKMLTTQPIKWKRVTANLKSASLIAGQDKYGVSLQKIQAGGRVPEHDHRGDELTVVLKGSFSDEDNVYQQGDFLLKRSGDKHQPIASNNQDCLCLSVEAAPVKLTSVWGKLLNPFLRINAA